MSASSRAATAEPSTITIADVKQEASGDEAAPTRDAQ
jgi:hypothetical protein